MLAASETIALTLLETPRKLNASTDSMSGPPSDSEFSVRIVILTGGTGSIALQRGLFDDVESNLDGVETWIIVNAYDNGFSTGAVRQVMNGEILGPSDVRKNQATRLHLENPNSPWLPLLNGRFTLERSKVPGYCRDQIIHLGESLVAQGVLANRCEILQAAVDEYFKSPVAHQIEYNDFSLANIVYAGLARANGNSLRTAASLMARAMNIADSVLINDDESLFLGAITRCGKRIADEGRIVSWGDEGDPFVDIFFTDAQGRDGQPRLCLEAWQTIVQADLIILSSGTQWSSLIPTYASQGFTAAVKDSDAKVVMVMNRTPDRDSPSQTASDIIDVLVPRYFEEGRLHVLADEGGHARMRGLSRSARSKVAAFTQTELSGPSDPPDKHAPSKLARAIGAAYFYEHLTSDFYLFDYDDTLVARSHRLPRSSRHNVKGLSRLNWLTSVGICSGNTIRAIELGGEPSAVGDASEPIYKPLLVFADGGINQYSYDTRPAMSREAPALEPECCVSPEALLPTAGPQSVAAIIQALCRAGVPPEKIDNRRDVLIAIKPVEQEQRPALIGFIRYIVSGSNMLARECGRTTIEICRATLSKTHALKHLRDIHPTLRMITYIGDEFDSGNDRDIQELAVQGTGVKCLRVKDPAETGFFIRSLLAHLSKNVER